MRLIHKGLILVGTPLLVAVITIAVIFGLILRDDQLRLHQQRHRQLEDITTESYLTWHDVLMHIDLDENALGIKGRLKAAALKMKDLHAQGIAIDPNYENDPTVQSWYGQAQILTDNLREVASTLKQNGFTFEVALNIENLRNNAANMLIESGIDQHKRKVKSMTDEHAQDGNEEKYYRLATYVCLAGIGLSLVAAIAFGLWFFRDISARLRIITDNTIRLGRGRELNAPLRGSDEIAALDRGFHIMAKSLREAMAREHSLFENASDIMCIMDENLRFSSVNPACKRILCYSDEEIIGTDVLQLVSPDDLKRTADLFAAVRSNEPACTFENRVRRKDGTELDLLWSIYWSDLDGAMYAVAHNISERKEIERLKEEFLAMVSHDLRSPLTSIYGAFKLTASGAFGQLPPAVGEKIDGVLTNINRLIGLVNDLLDVEKLEAGKVELVKEKVDLRSLVQRAVSEIEPLTKEKRVAIDVNCSEGAVEVDVDRLIQVLMNLLSNAIKFSPENSRITIIGASSAQALELKIIDQGRGVPENQRAAIFERFKQVEAADGQRKTGTGLGLPICKTIIEQHGGTIGVDSEMGKGSTFWIRIPTTGSAGAYTSVQSKPSVNTGSFRTVEKKPQPAASETGELTRRGSLFDNVRLGHKGALLIVMPLLFQIVFTASIYSLFTQAYQEKQHESHQLLVAENARDMMDMVATIGVCLALGDKEDVFPQFEYLSKEMFSNEASLEKLTSQDPQQYELTRHLGIIASPIHQFVRDEKIMEVLHKKQKYYMGRKEAFVQSFAELTSVSQTMFQKANALGSASPVKLKALRQQQGMLLAGGLAASLIICALSAVLFSRGIVGRLRISEDNVARLERDEPLNPQLAGSDEVAHVDHLFHSMVAALTEARHKERAVFDNSQDVICMLDKNGKLLAVNPACKQRLGFTRAEMLGHWALDFVAPDAEAAARTALQSVFASGVAKDIETRLVTKDGSAIETLLSLSWSADQQNVVAIAHDISQRKELERLKQEFLHMVSHDMRTPITAISTTTEMLTLGVFGELPEAVNPQLEIVSRNCDRLLTLINDLLDIEKLDAGQMQLVVAQTTAKEILDRTAEALSGMAQQKNINIQVQADPALTLQADGDRLVQVGVNLLSNAIKFSPEGSQVMLYATERQGWVEFVVRDNGRGVPPEMQQAIFERFRQVEAADAKHRSGTGLGLPICKRIVEQHGGMIGVQSEPGHGSAFYFRIPLTPAAVSSGIAQRRD